MDYGTTVVLPVLLVVPHVLYSSNRGDHRRLEDDEFFEIF